MSDVDENAEAHQMWDNMQRWKAMPQSAPALRARTADCTTRPVQAIFTWG